VERRHRHRPHEELAVHHPAALAHQFDSLEQQRDASTLGMWVFNQAFFISNNRLPGYAATIAMVQFVIVFAIALVAQYYLRRREAVL